MQGTNAMSELLNSELLGSHSDTSHEDEQMDMNRYNDQPKHTALIEVDPSFVKTCQDRMGPYK